MSTKRNAIDPDDELLNELQRHSFSYFPAFVRPDNGLVLDSSQPSSPVSIAAVGFALTSYPVAVERGFMKRSVALAHTLRALRFFAAADQTGAVDGVGFKGFFYHFLDPASGRRAWKSELSTIDTAILVNGMLLAAQYFSGSSGTEREVRVLAETVYARVDWRWAQNGGAAIALGWSPEKGFFKQSWRGYNEALLLYVLALGAPEYFVGPDAYAAWTSTFAWRRLYGHEVLYAGPLFIHQFSHVWIDLRGIADAFMATRNADYFENSRRATYVQQQYAIRNPRGFAGYDEHGWGLTATNGPDLGKVKVHGRSHRTFGYRARGAPFGPDDGTLAPWAQIASLPFAPELVLPAIRVLRERDGSGRARYGCHASYNPSMRSGANESMWTSPWHYAINQGPIVVMIENHRTGLVWRLMRDCEPMRSGLLRAGFGGGWLREDPGPESRC
ncbi:MAG: glucoamylase family protein [Polyangia bacterium]